MKSIKQLIEPFVYPHMEYFVDLVAKNGDKTEFLGIKVFEQQKELTQGTLVEIAVDLYIHYKKNGDPRAEQTLERVYRFLDIVGKNNCETWGKIGLLRCFTKLNDAGLLQNIDKNYIDFVRKKTDYFDFFNKEKMYVYPQYASNYLQLAMACAGLREKLGWENENYSERIKNKLMQLMQNSSEAGWMDEEPPLGRFDRYTFLVGSELSDSMFFMNSRFPEFARENLKRSAECNLFMANNHGDGICYGRSLSCHGDMATAEIIASALARGLIDEKDIDLAVNYCIKIIEKTLNFWYDKKRKSFNIWWDGRNTNDYRNSYRVLEVNLDMANHLLGFYENIRIAGLEDYIPKGEIAEPEKWALKNVKFVDLEKRKFQTAILKRNDKLVMLPFIGAGMWSRASEYLPVPVINRLVEAAPEGTYPFLTPQATDKQGNILRPVDYYEEIETVEDTDFVKITVEGKLAFWGENYSKKSSYSYKSEYIFNRNSIKVRFDFNCEAEKIEMLIGTHEQKVKIEPFGFDSSVQVDTKADYSFATPHGYITEAKLYTVQSNPTVGYEITL